MSTNTTSTATSVTATSATARPAGPSESPIGPAGRDEGVDVSVRPVPRAAPSDDAVTAFADRLFGDILGALSTTSIAIGVRLGWYEALAAAEPLTSTDLARTTDSDERYAREWLEQQAVAGIVEVVDASAAPLDRRFTMSPEAVEVLTNRAGVSYMAPFPGLVTTLVRSLDELVAAYRTGGGYGWHEHGDGARCGQAEANRPLFLNLLARDYLSTIPELDASLRGGGRLADIGCGMGWSSIGIALAYPDARVDGYDVDAPSIEIARANAAEAGVADRVTFHAVDAGEIDAGGYDVVLALECIHDLSDPVSVLSTMRSLVAADGTVVVMDERVGDEFTGRPDPIEQFMYGFSLICCLPDGRNAAESVATGAVMRRSTFEGYAAEAGFTGVEVLPLEHDFFRFYRLAH